MLTNKRRRSHKKRNIIIIVILILLIAVAVGGYFGYNYYQSVIVKTSDSNETSDYENITFDIVSEWNDKYQLSAMYPKTPNATINKSAKTEIDTYVTAFRKLVAENKNTSSRPLSLNIVGEVNFANDNFVNFFYDGTQYDGTTVSTLDVSQLYDIKTGQPVALAELFDGSDYLKVLSETSRSELKDILKDNYNQQLAEKGTIPTVDNFQNFELVDTNTFNIIFQPGQVVKESVGVVKAPIALSLVDDYYNHTEIDKFFPDYASEVKQKKDEAAAKKANEQKNASKDFSKIQPISQPDNVDCVVSKCIALTFDDGPSGGPTQSLLATLKSYNAKATFFMIGRQVAGRADVVKQAYDDGHEIGNHTWDHIDLATADAGTIKDQLDKTSQAIIDVVGKKPVLIRPPYGSYNTAALTAAQAPFIIWSVDPKDWKDKDDDTVYQRVMAGAKAGAIILSHDIYNTTATAYAKIIPELLAQGYQLVTVSDLLNLDDSKLPVQVFNQR
jgi:peptidoglycan/xylan/chitin deacetylase (PgdA/CDA1 family)